ncbi:hypothetical protein HDV01_003756 [Terramyces sp. JEL0728]|nr:hypothetical protein HDV01_003756 [Terramyces sp. JEL0728]
MSWQPNQTELQTLIQLLQSATSGNSSTQQLLLKQLEQYQQIPEYNNYLSFILSNKEIPETIRFLAGINLKNSLKSTWLRLDSAILDYAKVSIAAIVNALSDQSRQIQNIAGSIISTVLCIEIERWPEIIPLLLELLKNPQTIHGSFSKSLLIIDALEKICEDAADKIENRGVALVHAILSGIMPQIENPNGRVRSSALKCFNQFLIIRSNAVWDNIQMFMDMLCKLTSDPEPEVKKHVCHAFNNIVEIEPNMLVPVIDGIISFVLFASQDEDQDLAIEAADFWLVLSEQKVLHVHIQPYLPKILPVLLKGMVYSEDELEMLEMKQIDARVADREEDIKPRFHKQKNHELEGDHQPDEDDEDDESDFDDDFGEDWNLRKCSAAALDVLSTVFNDDLLPDLLPGINQMLHAQEWETMEAGILALGAIAQGCERGMEQHLPVLIPHLVTFINHEKPLVRSIACWTLGRYSGWMANPNLPFENNTSVQEHHHKYMLPVLQGFLQMCLDNNKDVQKAGCSALATLEEEARESLAPYLNPIIDTIVKCFQMYQKKNLLVLYDAFGILAEFVGEELVPYIDRFMPLLIAKWQHLADDNYDIFPLFECLSSIAHALGPAFLPYTGPVWERCLNMIKHNLIAIQNYKQNPQLEIPDKDFIIVSLDLISGIVQGLGPESEQFVVGGQEPTLLPILKVTGRDETPDVRSSTFALIGDLCSACFPALVPHLPEIFDMIGHSLYLPVDGTVLSAMNNAAWSAGEISIKYGHNMEVFVNPLLAKLIPFVLAANTHRSLTENAAITIGRLGCAQLSLVHDNQEKASAFMGICQMFVMFRDAMGDQWSVMVASFPENMQRGLKEVYGL